jgi:Fe-S-cluster-containing dehydrogenase component
MVIDLKRCIGCWACFVAYRSKNFLPRGIYWNRVVIGETGKYPSVRKEMFPVLCNHCEDSACVDACPTKVRVFGNLNDRESGISTLIRQRGGRQLHPEFGTNPSVYYLPA